MTKALAVVVLLLLAALGYQWGRAEHAGRMADSMRVERDAARIQASREREARAEETRRTAALQETLDAEHRARRALEDDVRRADAAAVGLRDRARQLAAAARCPAEGAAVASGSPPAIGPGDLLADMLERLDVRAGELARYADQARLAGLTCERSYDALTAEKSP